METGFCFQNSAIMAVADNDRPEPPTEPARPGEDEGPFAPDLDIPVPQALKAGGPFALYGSGGLGPLLFRLVIEDRYGDGVPDPLTPAELAQLVEAFADEPLPTPLRRLLVRHLNGQVKRRAGRKAARPRPWEEVQAHLLPFIYEEALADAKEEVKRLRAEAMETRRGPSTKAIKPATERAADQVRRLLPRYCGLTTEGILNLVSKMRSSGGPRRLA